MGYHIRKEISSKKRGRPRLDDAHALRSTITLSLSVSLHDALIRRASTERIPVSVLLRRLILQTL